MMTKKRLRVTCDNMEDLVYFTRGRGAGVGGGQEDPRLE